MRVNRKDLETALRLAEKVRDARANMPILGCVRLEADGTTATVTATDLNTSIVARIPCEGAIPRVVVDPKRLGAALGAAPKGKAGKDATVELGIANADGPAPSAVVYGAGGRSQINGEPPKDFPKIPGPPEGPSVRYSADQITAALDYTTAAASVDETRPHLCGVFVDGARMVATDGHRLHVYGDLPTLDAVPAIVPLAGARAALAAVRAVKPESVTMTISKGVRVGDSDEYAARVAWWQIDGDGIAVQVAVKVADACYPPIDQVIPRPDREGYATTVDADVLAAVLGEARTVLRAARVGGGAKVTGNGTLDVSVDVPDTATWTRQIPASTEHRAPEPNPDPTWIVGFNPDYLRAAVAPLTGPIALEVDGELDPVRIAQSPRLAVVMPMRI